jgi:hypothetical protein
MSGILLQRQRNNTVYIVCSWIGDRHVDVSRCRHVHGVCGRAIQHRIDCTVSSVSVWIVRWRGLCIMCCLCARPVRRRRGGGGGVRSEQCGITVRGVSGGACAGVGRADAVRGVRRGLDDGHAEPDGRRALHGVCGGAVQCGVDGGVLGVWGGIGDGGVEQDGGDIVHGVWRGSVQQCVDCSVHIVRSWLLSG